MHSGSIQEADNWLKSNLSSLFEWSFKKNTLVIITVDESSHVSPNRIFTIFYGQSFFAFFTINSTVKNLVKKGPMVKQGTYNEIIDHYSVLSMIQDMYGLSNLTNSAPVPGTWVNKVA